MPRLDEDIVRQILDIVVEGLRGRPHLPIAKGDTVKHGWEDDEGNEHLITESGMEYIGRYDGNRIVWGKACPA